MPPADSLTTAPLYPCKQNLCTQTLSPGTATARLLTDNLHEYSVPDTLLFEEKAIRWYLELLLNHSQADDMTGFDNGILLAYGMCPPTNYRNIIKWTPTRDLCIL
jgi:hypothetical protein